MLHTDYTSTTPEKLFNDGHTIELEYPHTGNHNEVTIGGDTFELLQFHFHSGSEHTVNGQQYDMELHLVHRNVTTGGLTVIGLFLDSTGNTENTVLKPFFDEMAAGNVDDNGDEVHGLAAFNADDLLSSLTSTDGWFYEGSLTTPPGTEGVNWFVFQEPLTISTAQLTAYQTAADVSASDMTHDFLPGNRPVQPLNGHQFNELNHEVTATNSGPVTANFGNYQGNAVVEGVKYNDINANGRQDTGEPGRLDGRVAGRGGHGRDDGRDGLDGRLPVPEPRARSVHRPRGGPERLDPE